MSDLSKAIDTIGYTILKTSDKEIYDNYTAGQRCPKPNPANDIDYLQQLNKSFFTYYNAIISSIPEAEQPIEKLKCRLAQEQLEAVIKTLTFNKNILDKNNFLFYNVAYVNDIIKRNSSINNQD